jgi:hypothetical protein
MTSSVDSTFPADNVKVSKATFRAQMLIIKDELTALQKRTSVAGAKAFYGYTELTDVDERILQYVNRKLDLPRQIAFGIVSI